MHLQGLDLNLLIALDALLSEQNVTRAAERMNISQPGMSAALQKLRYHFDDQLLQRFGRRLELTPRAQALVNPVKSILFEIRSLQGPEREFRPEEAVRTFRIALTTYVCEVLSIQLMQRVWKVAPGIAIHFEEMSSDTVRRISEGQIDFAILISARIMDYLETVRDTLNFAHLFSDEFVVAMSNDNEFKGLAISFDELADMDYAETRFSGVIEGITEQLWKQQPRQPKIVTWLPNFQLTLATVSQTQLVTILPALMVRPECSFAVRKLAVPFDVPRLNEQLIWHKRNENDPAHTWMIEMLKSTVAELNLI